MNKTVRNIMDKETPCVVVAIGNAEIRQYWTRNAGLYGHQIITVWFVDHCYAGYSKTSGCGYCKKGSGLWDAFKAIGLRARGVSCENEITYNYKIGGNYYKINKADTLNYDGKYIKNVA